MTTTLHANDYSKPTEQLLAVNSLTVIGRVEIFDNPYSQDLIVIEAGPTRLSTNNRRFAVETSK